jgi:hypothetical protein
MTASFCHVCDRSRDQQARDEDVQVFIRSGMAVPTCWRCWFLWPDEHKATWPSEGFGRVREPQASTGEVRLVMVAGGGLLCLPVDDGRRAA